MKAILILLSFMVIMLSIVSLKSFENKSENLTLNKNHQTDFKDAISKGAIGDVKYSVLPPEKFREENGNGWVLMDDKVPILGSTLDNKHGIKEIPDARGLFIRCLNGNRNDDKSDVFQNDSSRARLLGDYQADAVKKHNHNLSADLGYFGGWVGSNLFSGNTPGNPISIGNSGKTPIIILNTGQNMDGQETRPKNIALYAYIKINE